MSRLCGRESVLKKSQIDKAIEQLEGERNVIDLAISRLRAQQHAKPTPKPRKADVVPGSGAAK